MTNEPDRNRSKEPVTIRLDPVARAALQEIAIKDGRSVSSLIDLAVRELLERRNGGEGLVMDRPDTLKARFAGLPDTAILASFQRMAPKRFEEVRAAAGLPVIEFSQRRGDWRSLPKDVFSGDVDLVEATNWLPIFWHISRGGTSPRLDWIGPYLQVFVGHCVFVRTDYLLDYLNSEDLDEYLSFRNVGSSGRDLSLRSLVAWVARIPDDDRRRSLTDQLEQAWAAAIVACQLGTDYHVAVQRVAPILAKLSKRSDEADGDHPRETIIQGVETLELGYRDFQSGAVAAFIGNLVQAAELLAQDPPGALLLAGPADLRVPSLNTLAGRKGMFDPLSELGKGVLTLWAEAVRWFREEVVETDSCDALSELVASLAVGSKDENVEVEGSNSRKIEILKSLMQSWVRWFATEDEAKAFIDDGSLPGPRGAYSFEDIVSYYQELSTLLNPFATMTPPDYDSQREVALWKFPVLADRPGQARAAPRRLER